VRLTAAACLILASCATPRSGVEMPPVELPGIDRQAAPLVRGLVVIAHGVEGKADSWPVVIERALRALPADQRRWQIYRVDWYEASLNRLAAPRRGYELGRGIGTEIVRRGGYEVVHLIGHSAGAHVVHGIADVLDGLPPDRAPAVHATFLDPFVARSVARLYWGVRKFGTNVDFAESYVTRDDPIPFTNSYLRHAYNIDLTETLPPRDDPPTDYAHGWPIRYYTNPAAGRPLGIDISPMALFGSAVSAEHAREIMAGLARRYPPSIRSILPVD
jgi:hypothetical protein